MDILTLIIIAIVVLAAVGVGFVLVPYLKKKGLLQQESFDATKQVLTLASVVLQNLNFSNEEVKDKVTSIIKVTGTAVDYVEQVAKNEENTFKKDLAIKTSKDLLVQMGIEVNEDALKMIEIGIESAVSLLPKTNKIS